MWIYCVLLAKFQHFCLNSDNIIIYVSEYVAGVSLPVTVIIYTHLVFAKEFVWWVTYTRALFALFQTCTGLKLKESSCPGCNAKDFVSFNSKEASYMYVPFRMQSLLFVKAACSQYMAEYLDVPDVVTFRLPDYID